MKAQPNIKKNVGKRKYLSLSISFILIFSVLQTAQAVHWNRIVSSGSSFGVILEDELPRCWFSASLSYFDVGSTFDITFSGIQYDSVGMIIEYYADGTGDGYPIETHVYDITYSGSDVTGFKERRHYPASGNIYEIELSNVTYNAQGRAQSSYDVVINSGYGYILSMIRSGID